MCNVDLSVLCLVDVGTCMFKVLLQKFSVL